MGSTISFLRGYYRRVSLIYIYYARSDSYLIRINKKSFSYHPEIYINDHYLEKNYKENNNKTPEMEGNVDIYKVLDELQQTMRNMINNRYLEVVNELNDGFNKLLQRALTSADTFDVAINSTMAQVKEQIAYTLKIKEENIEYQRQSSPHEEERRHHYNQWNYNETKH